MAKRKQTTYTTVNFDRQNPSLTITRIKDNKQVTVFDIAKFTLKRWTDNSSLFMVMRILEHCMKHECQVYTVKDGYELGNNIQSKVMAFAFGLAAEIERDMISKRTKEGLAKRKSDGVVLGRPLGSKSKSTKCDPLKAKIQSFLNKKLSYSAIGRLLKINRLTISKYCIDNNMVEKVVKPKKKEKNLNLDIMFEDKEKIIHQSQNTNLQMTNRTHNSFKFDPAYFSLSRIGRYDTWEPILTGYSFNSREFVIDGKIEIRVLESRITQYQAMLDRLQRKLLRFKKYNNRRVFESWITNNDKKVVIFT